MSSPKTSTDGDEADDYTQPFVCNVCLFRLNEHQQNTNVASTVVRRLKSSAEFLHSYSYMIAHNT